MAAPPSPPDSWTVGDLIKWAANDFQKLGIETARLDAEILLANALGCSRVELYMKYDLTPTPSALDSFRESVKRRRKREPVAHIIGTKAFHEIEVMVPPGMFVPRPETEILVDEALQRLKGLTHDPRALDLCAGTGAIALALLKARDDLRAWAVDVDPAFLDTAMANALRLIVSGRITLLQGDLYQPLAGLPPFDLIACNPPYVPSPEIDSLMPEVRDHEPRAALDGGGDGLDVVRRVIEGAAGHLRHGGWLLIEVGEGQARAVEAMAGAELKHQATRSDLQGIPRVVIFEKPAA